MFSFISLAPLSRQRLSEKRIETEDVTLDPSDPAYPHDVSEAIDKFINIVAKDSAPDSNKRLAKWSKDATTCVRSKEK